MAREIVPNFDDFYKEGRRTSAFADSAFGSYRWMISFSVFAFTILAVVIEVQAI